MNNIKTESEKFYTPPKKEAFKELRLMATILWHTYDDTYGYATEKINRIKDLKNEGSNFMLIWDMFDPINQSKLITMLSQETVKSLKERDSSNPNF